MRDLESLLDSEGLPNARIKTYAGLAEEIAQPDGTTAISSAERWLLFCSALRECSKKTSRLIEPSRMSAFKFIETLTSYMIKSDELRAAAEKSTGWRAFEELLGQYENLIGGKRISGLSEIITAAIIKVKSGNAGQNKCFAFDLIHETRPDEFQLAVALAEAGSNAVFLCDEFAPAPSDRPVVKNPSAQAQRHLKNISKKQAADLPNGRPVPLIVEGSPIEVGENVEILEFTDRISEFRAIAAAAASSLEKGISVEDAAFYLKDPERDAELLLYELRLSGFPVMPQPVQTNALKRESKLILDLAADLENDFLKKKALAAGLAANPAHLNEMLASLSQIKDSGGFEEVVEKSLRLFLPETNELENEALKACLHAARDFERLAASGNINNDLALFSDALVGYFREKAANECEMPAFFLTSSKPASRVYDIVFLPSMVAGNAAPAVEFELKEYVSLLESSAGKPVSLPEPRFYEARKRWEIGAAAAHGNKAVLSFYRQEAGRSIRPAQWLRKSLDQAEKRASSTIAAEKDVPCADMPGLPGPPKSLSATSIKSYLSCPHMFYLETLLGIRAPAGAPQLAGSLVHKALAIFHNPGESDFSADRMQSILERIAPEFELDQERLTEAALLLERYATTDELGREKTIAVEKGFEFNLAGIPIRGKIDRIVEVPGGIKIIDYKLRGKGKELKHKNAVLSSADVQMPLYVHATREIGYEVKAFSYIYLDFEKLAKPYEITLRLGDESKKDQITGSELQDSLEALERVVREIATGKPEYQKGENAPCRRMGWCNFKGICTVEDE